MIVIKVTVITNVMFPGYAAMTGKTDIVKVLIKEKAEINGLDGHGETPLIKVSFLVISMLTPFFLSINAYKKQSEIV